MRNHCWHETGTGTSTTFVNAMDVVCCWCKATTVRKYVQETKTLTGHGEHFARTIMVARPIEYEEECKDD